MYHLPSSFIERVNTPEIKQYFLNTFSPLVTAICNEHKSKDRFHDFENVFGVGYITTLIIYYFNGLNLRGMEDFDIIIKSSLLQNYCFQNNDLDELNIAHTLEELYKLKKKYPGIFDDFEQGEIELYISLTDKNFEIDEIDEFITNEQLMYQILFDSYILYPALCFNTKILNDLYLDMLSKYNFHSDMLSNSSNTFAVFKERKLKNFKSLKSRFKTSFGKIVYKEIENHLLSLCSACKENV